MMNNGSAADLVFRGIDGTEAEEFIAAIQELAFAEGWSQDRERMLLFARSRLRHKALRWFATLDPSIENDWKLFIEALFSRYPPIEAPREAGISTPEWSSTTFSPGASTTTLPSDQALDLHPTVQNERQTIGCNRLHSSLPPSKQYDPSVPGRRLGILRIVVEDEATCPQYVWRGGYRSADRCTDGVRVYFERLGTTVDRQDALVIGFIPGPGPHPISCLNASSGFDDLSIYYYHSASNAYELRVADGVMTMDQNTSQDRNVSKVWNVLSDGSLEMSLPEFDRGSRDSYGNYARKDIKTSEVLLYASGTSFRFVKPGTLPWQDDPKRNTQGGRFEIKARIVFEPF